MQKVGKKYLNVMYIAGWKVDIRVVFVFTHSYVACRRLLTYMMWRGTCKLRQL